MGVNIMEADNRSRFLDLYSRLETDIKAIYGLSDDDGPVDWLAKRGGARRGGNASYFDQMRQELFYCKDVRNVLAHKPRLNDDYLVQPNEALIKILQSAVDRLESIPSADQIKTNTGDLCRATMEDQILPKMRIMAEENYTYVPILENGRVKGVFSASALLSHVIDEGIVGFDEGDTFGQIESYLSLDAYDSESFRFVAVDLPAPRIAEMFQDSLGEPKRLGAVFVTNSGSAKEALLGMITSWDLVSY